MQEPLTAAGISVERFLYPTKLDISSDESTLQDPGAYPITVHMKPTQALNCSSTFVEAYLQSTNPDQEAQAVHARFIIGTDGNV